MNLIKTFIQNFLYGGLLMGFALTVIDFINDSDRSIALYAFLSGSFFIINLMQYNYIYNSNDIYVNTFLIHSVIGGIVWVLFGILLYYLHVLKIDMTSIMLINLFAIIITSVIYYMWLKRIL